MTEKPLLIVVSGRPGSGKSTLARLLARELRCPLLSRDEFKEGLVNTLELSHRELPEEAIRDLYGTFFETVERLLERKISLVIEAAFQHRLWAPRLEPLVETCKMRIVLCTVDAELARTRFLERRREDPSRERFHGDSSFPPAYDPPRLPVPTLEVDSSSAYVPGLAEIVSFCYAT